MAARPSFNAAVQLYPRRKAGTSLSRPVPKGRSPMLLSYQAVASLFGRPQTDAALRLGISLTSLKQVCRKLGVLRWPYTRPRKAASAKKRMQAAEAAQTKAEESDSSDASHLSAETTHASPGHHFSLLRENFPTFPGPPAAPPGEHFEFAERRSSLATFAAERTSGDQAMRTHRRHDDDACLPFTAPNACGIMRALLEATNQAPVGGARVCEPESRDLEDDQYDDQGHELGGTDMSWLVSEHDRDCLF